MPSSLRSHRLESCPVDDQARQSTHRPDRIRVLVSVAELLHQAGRLAMNVLALDNVR